MKLSIETKELKGAFSNLLSVCPVRSPKPILSSLRLQHKKGRFTLEATDLEVWARRAWSGKSDEAADLLLPGGSVGGLLKEIDDETISVEEKEKGIEIATRDTKSRHPKIPAVEFPAWPDLQKEGSFRIPAGKLVEALRRTGFAAAQEKTRYALNGVLVALAGKGVEWVATDGRRLALAKSSASDVTGEGKAILGLKAVATLERMFSETGQEVEFSFDKRFFRAASEDLEVIGRLVEGAYPDYRAVIPKGLNEKVTVRKADLEKAVRKAALMTAAGSGSVGLRLAEGGIEISGQSPEEGEIKVAIKARYAGAGFSIRFNPRFLLDAFRITQVEDLEIDLKDSSSPALMKLGEGSLYVVLPVHLVS